MQSLRHMVAAGCGLLAFTTAYPAAAAPKTDLAVTLTAPSTPGVGDLAHYEVDVVNLSARKATNVVLTVELPKTQTSPNVFVMGDLQNVDPRCSIAGTDLRCDLFTMSGSTSLSPPIGFDLALPYASTALTLKATVITSTPEVTTANNVAQQTVALSYEANPVVPPQFVDVTSCTGHDLTSFFECTVSPGSTQTRQFSLLVNGTVTYLGTAVGYWQQPTADSLDMQFGTPGNWDAVFAGKGVDAGCFEGVTTFPSSLANPPWVSPWQVCM